MALHRIDRRRIALAAALLAAAVLGSCAQPRPAPPPAPPAQAAAPPEPPPPAPRLEPEYGLYFDQDGDSAKLAYGKANSDDVQLMLQCEKGSRRIEVIEVARGEVKKGRMPLVLRSGPARSEVKAEVGPDETGLTLAIGEAPADLPALAAFRATGALTVELDGRDYPIQAKDGDKPGVARFFSACERK